MANKIKSGTKAEQKSSMFNRENFFVINIALLSLSIAFLIASLVIQNQNNSVIPFGGYKTGVIVSMGSAQMQVKDVSSTSGSGMFQAPKGKNYLILNLWIKNTSEKPIYVLPSTDTYLKDFNGKITLLTPYNLTNPFRAGELLPGDQIEGQLSYLVPVQSNQRFYIDAIWSGGVVPFAIPANN